MSFEIRVLLVSPGPDLVVMCTCRLSCLQCGRFIVGGGCFGNVEVSVVLGVGVEGANPGGGAVEPALHAFHFKHRPIPPLRYDGVCIAFLHSETSMLRSPFLNAVPAVVVEFLVNAIVVWLRYDGRV